MILGIILFIYIAIIFVEIVSETFIIGTRKGWGKGEKYELTPRFVRMSFIWPLRFALFLTMALLNVGNDFLAVILLAFGFYYKETKVYKFIDNGTLKLTEL
jgi:hypothetical protein